MNLIDLTYVNDNTPEKNFLKKPVNDNTYFLYNNEENNVKHFFRCKPGKKIGL
jgi:hypothetical protein